MAHNTERLKTLRDAKAAGIDATEAYEMSANAIVKAAKEDGWRLSERAASMGDLMTRVEKVYGKKKAKVAADMWYARQTNKKKENQDALGRVLSPKAHLDICTCGCARTEHHGSEGHLQCSNHPGCARFTWSHFAKEKTP